jgi:hypothetical protein
MSRIKLLNLIILIFIISFICTPIYFLVGVSSLKVILVISILIFIPSFFMWCLKYKCPKCKCFLIFKYKNINSSLPDLLYCENCSYEKKLPELGVTFDK